MAYIGKQPTPVPLSASDLDDDIISLAKLASGTDGNLITYDASGNPAAVATGDDGQVLTSAGAGQPCAFEAAAGGGAWTKIKAQTASADSSIDFLNGTDDVVYDDTYDLYMVTIVGLRPAADDYLSLRYYIDGTWRTDSTYRYGLSRPTTGDWTWQYSNSNANSLIELGNADGGAVGESGNRRCYFYQPASTVNKPQMEWAGCKANSSGVLGHYNGAGWYAGTGAEAEACTGIRFYFPSNNIAVGNFVLYGLTK